VKRLLLAFLVIFTICAFGATGALGYMITAVTNPTTGALFSTKWEPGGDSASMFDPGPARQDGPGTAGGATWSVMAPGHLAPIGDTKHPVDAVSLDFFGLTAFADGSINTSHFPGGVITVAYDGLWGLNVGDPVPYEALAIDWALDQWAGVSGFSNLGPVADGDGGTANNGTPPDYLDWNGNGASDANGGNVGDIRVAAYDFLGAVLADTTQPGDASSPGFGPFDNIGGDGHFANTVADIAGFHWLNDPDHSLDSGPGFDPNGYDFLTNILHEMGHGLGLAHRSEDPAYRPAAGVVMDLYTQRRTALRDLTADDIAGIQEIYGPADIPDVPEPATLALVGLGVLGLVARRRS